MWLVAEPHAEHFSVSDVYFAELAILYSVCENGDELWQVGEGHAFGCVWSKAGYARLIGALLGREANLNV